MKVCSHCTQLRSKDTKLVMSAKAQMLMSFTCLRIVNHIIGSWEMTACFICIGWNGCESHHQQEAWESNDQSCFFHHLLHLAHSFTTLANLFIVVGTHLVWTMLGAKSGGILQLATLASVAYPFVWNMGSVCLYALVLIYYARQFWLSPCFNTNSYQKTFTTIQNLYLYVPFNVST